MRRIHFLFLFLFQIAGYGQRPELVVPRGHTSNIDRASFSPDGKYLLTSGWDGSTIIWDTWSGRELRTFYATGLRGTSISAFSPDGKYIVINGGVDLTVKVLDFRSGKLVRSFPSAAMHSLFGQDQLGLFSPDSKKILTVRPDSTYVLWDIDSGKEIQSFWRGWVHVEYPVAFSPDGQYLATGDEERVVLWDVLTGERIRTFAFAEETEYENVRTIAFSPDGSYLLAGRFDGQLQLWETATAKQVRSFQHHDYGLYMAMFSPDGQQILASTQAEAFLWKLDGKKIGRFPPGAKDVSYGFGRKGISFSADGKYLVTTGAGQDRLKKKKQRRRSGDGQVMAQLWDREGNLIQEYKGHLYSGALTADLSPDGRHLFFGGKIWDFKNQGLRDFLISNYTWSISYAPDGESLWLAGVSTLTHFNLDKRIIKSFEPDGYQGDQYMTTIDPSSDGEKILLHSSFMNLTKLFDADGKELRQFNFEIEEWPQVMALHPDGQKILTGNDEGDITLWDLSLTPLLRFHGHEGAITDLAFSTDGQGILSGSEDRTAKLWNLNGQVLQTFAGHEQSVCHVDFFPGSQKVLTTSADERIHIWDVGNGTRIASLMLLDSSDWVVTTPSGLFDASPGALHLMYFLVDQEEEWEVIELDQLKERYYKPGLLPKLLGYSD